MSLNIALVLRTIPESRRRIGWIKILMGIGFSLAEIEEYVEREESGFINQEDMEKLRRVECNNLLEFRKEIPVQWRRERKAEFVSDKIASLKMFRWRMKAINCPFWLFKVIWDIGEGDKWLKRKRFLEKLVDNGITDDMISTAREYSWDNLLEFSKGKAFCPFHNDVHNPNFSVKGGRGRCWACGWAGDSIDFICERDGLTFVDAVKFLSGGE